MKTEKKTTLVKHHLTDADRDACMKLWQHGLSCMEIARLVPVSKSTVGYIKRAYTACIDKNWDILREMSTYCKPTVDWAMKVTNTTYPIDTTPLPEEPAEIPEVEMLPVPNDADDIRTLLKDIRSLLTDIRDMWR